jgi:hypothetical protein
MKTPRIEDFDPNIKKKQTLKSSLEDMPVIENAGNTAIRQASDTASHKAVNTASQQDVKPALQQTSNTASRHSITPTEKVTYRFHPEGKYALEDMKTLLERKHGIKASLGEIAEESILQAYEELLKTPDVSKLAIRLARKP